MSDVVSELLDARKCVSDGGRLTEALCDASSDALSFFGKAADECPFPLPGETLALWRARIMDVAIRMAGGHDV